jgi:hypothetical protein
MIERQIISKEVGKTAAQKYLETVFGLPAAAVRITALIDLADGRNAFVGRANTELSEKSKWKFLAIKTNEFYFFCLFLAQFFELFIYM